MRNKLLRPIAVLLPCTLYCIALTTIQCSRYCIALIAIQCTMYSIVLHCVLCIFFNIILYCVGLFYTTYCVAQCMILYFLFHRFVFSFTLFCIFLYICFVFPIALFCIFCFAVLQVIPQLGRLLAPLPQLSVGNFTKIQFV